MKTESKSKEKSKTSKAAESTAKGVNKTGDFMARNTKTFIYLGLGAIVLYAGYKAFKSVDKIGDMFFDDPNSGGGNLGDIWQPAKTPTGATINLIQAQTIAADLLSAVDGWGGLNEKEYKIVENALKNRTPKDFQLISEAFGTPPRDPLTGGQTFAILGQKLNLSQWLTQELSGEQKTRIKIAAPLIF